MEERRAMQNDFLIIFSVPVSHPTAALLSSKNMAKDLGSRVNRFGRVRGPNPSNKGGVRVLGQNTNKLGYNT